MTNKRIIFYVTRQYMKKNKKRTITTLIGIFFMVLMMTCVFIGKDTSLSYLTQVASAKNGSWHVSIRNVNEKQYEKIRALNYIDQTAVSQTYGYTMFEQSANKQKPFLNVKAYSKDCFDWMNIKLESGRLPKDSSELVISEQATKDNARIAIGDQIEIDCFNRYLTGSNQDIEATTFPFFDLTVESGKTVAVPQNFPYYENTKDFTETHKSTNCKRVCTIVGFIAKPSYETADSADYTGITYMDNNVADGISDSGVNVLAKCDLSKLDHSNYWGDLDKIMGSYDKFDSNSLLLGLSANSADNNINRIVRFLTVFFVFFIMAASIVLIYNVFNMSFDERSHYIGMLSSVGCTKQQRRSSVYYEALLLWLVAVPCGILAGAGVVKAVMYLIQPHIADMISASEGMAVGDTDPVRLSVSLQYIGIIIIFSFLTVIISSWIPAHKIGKVGAIESIRGNGNLRAKNNRINNFLVRHCHPKALLAVSNVKRQKAKTRGIIRALAVFMIILIVTAFGADTATKVVHYRLIDDAGMIENMDGWDYVLMDTGEKGKAYQELKQEIMTDEGVSEVREWCKRPYVGSVSNDVLSKEYWKDHRSIASCYYKDLSEKKYQEIIEGNENGVGILALDQDSFTKIANKSKCDKKLLTDTNQCPVLVYQNAELSSKNIQFEGFKASEFQFYQTDAATDKAIGDRFPVTLYGKNKLSKCDVTIAGYATAESVKKYVTFHSEQLWLITNMDTAKKIAAVANGLDDSNGNVSDLYASRELHIKINKTETNVTKKLRDLADKDNNNYTILRVGKESMVNTILEAVEYIIKILAIGFVLLTSMICLLNLYNSIWSRANARKQEFAILKSIGMTAGQLHQMLILENIKLFFRGLIWTGIFTGPIIWYLKNVISDEMGRLRLGFPWMIFLVAAAIAAGSLILITRYCYRKKKDENILEEIRMENV